MSSRERIPDTATPDDAWYRHPSRVVLAFVAVLLVAIAGGVLGARLIDDGEGPQRIVSDVADPVAPAALPDGGFLFAERTTGRILESTPGGSVIDVVQVPDELRTDGQRGVLGLTVRRHGEGTEVYASWTRAQDSRLVVGRFVEDRRELVWEGPVTTDIANGGTLAFHGEDLLIGVGELEDPEAVADPTTPNGKILALDPEGDAAQAPAVVASGWHNPFAMAVVDDAVWLVDNAPGEEPERLVRIPAGGDPEILELDGRRAPSGLDVLPDGDLIVCGFRSEVVERIPTPEDVTLASPTEELGPPCRTGVTVLADGAIVTTTTDDIWLDPHP